MVPLGFRGRSRVRGRDFSQTSYRTPVTVKRLARAYNQPKKHSRWGSVGWVLASLALASVVASALFSPLFNVRNVIITGAPSATIERQLHNTVMSALGERRWGIVPRSNLLLLGTGELASRLSAQFNSHGVTFERIWPNVLRVILPPNALVAVWQVAGKSFLVDQQGSVAQDVTAGELPSQLAVVHQVSGPVPSLNQSVANKDFVSLLQQLPPLWASQVKPALAYIEVDPQNLPSIRAYSATGWYAYFTSENPLQGQLTALHDLLEAKVQADEPKLDYIDVRFGSKLYYKFKDSNANQAPQTTP